MNELINVTLNDSQDPVVSGRQLHEVLGVKTEYRKWFGRMAEYGFEENQDFARVTQKCPTPGGLQDMIDHVIKLDMAKEIAMIQRTDKGKEVRQYFIQVEKDFNSPEKIMARALLMADKKVHKLEVRLRLTNRRYSLRTQSAQVTRLSWSETLLSSSVKTATKSEAIVFLSGCVKMAT